MVVTTSAWHHLLFLLPQFHFAVVVLCLSSFSLSFFFFFFFFSDDDDDDVAGERVGTIEGMSKLVRALDPRSRRAAASYARAASSGVSNVPSQCLHRPTLSLISADHRPHGRRLTPLYLFSPVSKGFVSRFARLKTCWSSLLAGVVVVVPKSTCCPTTAAIPSRTGGGGGRDGLSLSSFPSSELISEVEGGETFLEGHACGF